MAIDKDSRNRRYKQLSIRRRWAVDSAEGKSVDFLERDIADLCVGIIPGKSMTAAEAVSIAVSREAERVRQRRSGDL